MALIASFWPFIERRTLSIPRICRFDINRSFYDKNVVPEILDSLQFPVIGMFRWRKFGAR
jgi:hypothetical protein